MSTNQVVIELKKLVQSEIGDFFAGFGQPNEPKDAEEMHHILKARIESCFDTADEIRSKLITMELATDLELALAHQHIEELHECIADEDLEKAKALMADFIDDETPF